VATLWARDPPDLRLEVRFVPQGKDQALAHPDHHHLSGDVENRAPAQPVDVERPGGGEIAGGEGDERDARIHAASLAPMTDTEAPRRAAAPGPVDVC
jgi:hypothetical protein